MKVIYFFKEKLNKTYIKSGNWKKEFHYSYENIFANYSGLVVWTSI